MIEGIVRPFQSPRVTTSGQIPLPSVGAVTPASLRWGGAGKLPASNINFNGIKDTYDEQSRTTDVVRIFNPNDPTQYVDVQRTKSLKMNHTGGAGSVLYSPFTADIAAAFSEFSAQVQSAFSDLNVLGGPTTGGQGAGGQQNLATFNFNPPD